MSFNDFFTNGMFLFMNGMILFIDGFLCNNLLYIKIII